jgi:glycosyltransferase involved in cell wall biosynthesis
MKLHHRLEVGDGEPLISQRPPAHHTSASLRSGHPAVSDEPLVMHVRVVSGTGGGPDKTILNSPRFLARRGYRCVCVYLRSPSDSGFAVLGERAAGADAPLEAVDDYGVKDLGIVSRIRQLIHQYQPAIWHGHDYKSNLLGLVLRRQHPMQLITTVHGWVQQTWKTPLYYAIDRQCLKRYDRVICVSQDLYDDCRRIGIKNECLSLIENAIAIDDYELNLSREQARERLGLPLNPFLVVAVGRLSQEKGFDLLIQAVTMLIRAGQDVTLAIAGEGSDRTELERCIAESGCGDRIRLLGFVSDPRIVYRAADAYVLSSRREGLPNVVLEAMVMGVPVLATRVAGMPALIQNGSNGRLISPESVDELVSGLTRLLGDEDERARLATAGRATVESKFSFKHRMDKIVSVYQSLGYTQRPPTNR